jgi:hypothetical protein
MDNQSSNKHADGWESDDIFRSMRRNCEAYKKVKKENEQLKLEIDTLRKQIQILSKEPTLNTWSDYILYVCKDGKQRTSRGIFNIIDQMKQKPWTAEAKTPWATCGRTCIDLFKNNKLYKTNDSPVKYFSLIK